jgi:hypothetical protein
MNIIFENDDFKIENTFFLEKKKNVVIDGCFSKIIYSDEHFTMNGLFFSLPLLINNETVGYAQNKHVIYFNSHLQKNLLLITKFSEIENSIINYYKKINGIRKNSNLILTNQLYNGYFKLYKERETHLPNKKYILKISGLWETRSEVGITFKFMEIYDD